jgi:hypothetical protein
MRTDKAPEDLAPNECVDIEGLHIVAGRLVVDTGYVPYNGDYIGVSQGVFQVFFNDGSVVLLLFTTEAIYTWSTATLQWQPVSQDSIRATTAGPYSAGANVFSLDSVANVTIGTLVGLTLDDGSELITTVTNVSVLDITTTDVVPVGRTVASGVDVFVSPTMHGDVQKSQLSVVVFPGNDWVIFSNGVDEVSYYFQGVVTKLPDLPSSTTCGAIAVFHETVLLANTTEGGTHLPHRVRQSDLGDPSNWTTGIAAIYDLLDTDDIILRLESLGPWMIAYREQSIMRASYLGVLNEILFWEYMTQLEGAQSQGAVVNVGGEHVFVGHAGIYAYQGGYTLDNIGDGVFNNFLAPTGDFNTPARITLFTIFLADLDEVWVFYPAGQSKTPNKMLRVQLENNAWAVRVFAQSFVAANLVLPFALTTWATAKGQWNSPLWARPWDSRSLIQNIPSVALSPATADGPLALYEYRAQTDDGAVIPWTLTTKQLGDGYQFSRWELASVVAAGAGVLVERSEDEGTTWVTVGTFDFGPAPAIAAPNVYIDHVSTRLQLRLSGTDPTFTLRYVDVVSLAETEW